MKYYDSTSMKVRDTEDNKTNSRYNEDVLSVRNIFSLITLPIMLVTVAFQLIWFNIILHTALCSVIITLSFGMVICDYIQRDMRKMATPIGFITFWLINIIINLIKVFVI